jgi:tetratricopeptide (TPR) repeat protein
VALVIEVADTILRRDRTIKARLYARARAAVYWIVNIPKAWVEHRPVRARPVGWPGRALRWARRDPMAAGLLAILGTVFLTAFVAVLLLWGRAEASRRDAEMSRNQARDQGDRAEENFQEAQVVVKQLTQVGPPPLRRGLLETALGYYRRLLAQRGEDRHLWADTAEIHYELGALSQGQGAWAEAADAYAKAVAIYRQLAEEDPSDPNCPIRLAECYTALGPVYEALDRPREAEASWNEAVERLGALAGDNADVSQYRRMLAGNQARLAQFYADAERWSDAEKAHRAALHSWQELCGQLGADVSSQCGLAEAHNDLGYLYRDQDRARDALRHNQQALDVLNQVAGQHRTDRLWRAVQANSLLGAGSSYRLLGETARAAELLQQALPLWQQLHSEQDEKVWYTLSLAETHVQLGAVRRAEHEYRAALARYDEAVGLLEALLQRDGENKSAKDWLGQAREGRSRVYAQTGRREEAVRELQRALDLSRGRGRARLLNGLRKDEELTPLRTLAGFRRLLADPE